MKPILTSDFTLPADGFVHAVALGETKNHLHSPDPDHPGQFIEQPVIQVLDNAACERMVALFNAAAAAPDFAGILIDYDHGADDPNGSTEAAGWVLAMENRADGLWIKPRWTDTGAAAVTGGRFRYLSPVFLRNQCEVLPTSDLRSPTSALRLRPLAVHRWALTNDPNMRTLKPLSNRASGDDAAAQAQPQKGKSNMDYRKKLLDMLGLPDTATDAEIEAACASGKAAMTDAATVATERDTLKNRVAELETAQLAGLVESDLAEFKDVIENREEVKKALLINRAVCRQMLGAIRKPIAAAVAAVTSTEPLRNRAEALPPEDNGVVLSDKQMRQARAKQLALVNRVRKERGLTYDAAWELTKAGTLNPEL